jgi:hypothetical protein
VDGGRVGCHLLWSDADSGSAHQGLGIFALLGQNHGHDVARISGTRGASGPVKVSLVLGRRIDVYHQLDSVDVHAARGDVGCHQHPSRPRAERGEISIARGLRKVAVQVNCRHS